MAARGWWLPARCSAAAGRQGSYLGMEPRAGGAQERKPGSRLGEQRRQHHGSRLGGMSCLPCAAFISPVSNSMSRMDGEGLNVLSGTREQVKRASFPDSNVSFSNTPTGKPLVFGCSQLTVHSTWGFSLHFISWIPPGIWAPCR